DADGSLLHPRPHSRLLALLRAEEEPEEEGYQGQSGDDYDNVSDAHFASRCIYVLLGRRSVGPDARILQLVVDVGPNIFRWSALGDTIYGHLSTLLANVAREAMVGENHIAVGFLFFDKALGQAPMWAFIDSAAT